MQATGSLCWRTYELSARMTIDTVGTSYAQRLSLSLSDASDAAVQNVDFGIRGESAAETARLHRLERMRTRLLEDEAALSDIAATWPGADLQHLRQLRRNALKEQETAKPPKNFRAIFQALQELDQKGAEHAGE